MRSNKDSLNFKTILKCSRCCRILLLLIMSMNMSGCVCFIDIYEQWNDRSSLGDDIVSMMHKDKISEGKHHKWIKLTNDFFSSYRDKREVVEYFKSIGGECLDLDGEFIAACRVTLKTSWYGKKSICHKPEFLGIQDDVFIYKFKKSAGRFYFEYEWDFENSTHQQLPFKW